MLPLPAHFAGLILAFAPLFVQRSWRHAHLLLVGAILTPGRRTVTSVLRIMGRAQERRFVNVHRILNRAAWCPRTGSRILLGLLVHAFAQRGPVILGLDDTIERRRGKRITAKGIYRDPVCSSDSLLVALTVTLALCMPLLTGRGRPGEGAGAAAHDRQPPVVRWTRARYEALWTPPPLQRHPVERYLKSRAQCPRPRVTCAFFSSKTIQ